MLCHVQSFNLWKTHELKIRMFFRHPQRAPVFVRITPFKATPGRQDPKKQQHKVQQEAQISPKKLTGKKDEIFFVELRLIGIHPCNLYRKYIYIKSMKKKNSV